MTTTTSVYVSLKQEENSQAHILDEPGTLRHPLTSAKSP